MKWCRLILNRMLTSKFSKVWLIEKLKKVLGNWIMEYKILPFSILKIHLPIQLSFQRNGNFNNKNRNYLQRYFFDLNHAVFISISI